MVTYKMKKNINTVPYWNNKYESFKTSNLIKGVHKKLYEKVADAIFSVRHNSILDIGAGAGPIPKILKKRKFKFTGRRYVAVDFSQVGLNIIKSRIASEVETYNVRVDKQIVNNNIEKNSFDIVICCEVLEHLTNYMDCMRNCSDFVKNDGLVIVTVPINRIMVRDHYRTAFGKREIIDAHDAVDLKPYVFYKIERWCIVKSRKINLDEAFKESTEFEKNFVKDYVI